MKDYRLYAIYALGRLIKGSVLADKNYLKILYRYRIGKKLNIDNPKSFNEKMQWLKLYDRKPLYTQLVDKYLVRKYIANKISDKYLVPLLGVWDNFDDINFNQLPEKFVLKCTHDSGGVVICKNKNNFNIKKARKKIKHCLKRNYFYNTREWPYKNVRPRVIAEKYIGNDIEKGLKDYKIMCFNGVAKCSLVCSNRNTEEGVHITFYDNDWNIMPFKRSYSKQQKAEKCPSNFNEMKEIAEYLAKEMPFARIDFYEDNDKIYFGEITLYPGSGFKKFVPESYDLVLGSWLDLSHEKFDKELR